MKTSISDRIERLLLALWIGGLWSIGYLAVPVLFHSLPDKQLAGAVAGQMFTAIHVVGLVCGGILLLNTLVREQRAVLRQWRSGLLLLILLLLLLGLVVLQPQMAAIKLQPDWQQDSQLAARFAMLHGIASLVYLAASAVGLVLVMAGLRPPTVRAEQPGVQ